ncbi:endonuclease III [Candidatus Bathyarchaeota archaeon]|nr:endonuclease III [Candidatus Bathyarchaeota archaeon]
MTVKRPEVYLEPKARAQKVMELLEKEHADAEIALSYKNPLELLIATILSAQATDEQINALTPKLFQKYTTAKDYANAELTELEQDIKSSGFYHNKAKNLKNSAKLLVEKYNSQVPKTMEELVELPGVARKTANIVLFNAYGVIAGVAVDTHVRRLSQRLGLTENTNQDKIEKDLMNIVPKDKWMRITDLLIFHGRRVCNAKKPRCDACVLNKLCPSAFTFG